MKTPAFLLSFLWVLLSASAQTPTKTVYLSDIQVRDPYILADTTSHTYYLYVQNSGRSEEKNPNKGVDVYQSKDLQQWTGPTHVLTLPNPYWARKSVWAPEVHAYQGKYYLFVTLTSEDKLQPEPGSVTQQPQWKRGTQIFYASSPLGPFKEFAAKSHTPPNWMSLDGTLFVEKGLPYLVFCHEWAQIHDGTIEMMPLSKNLSKPIGKPTTLFKASTAPWVKNMQAAGLALNGLVTDGPFLYHNAKGQLVMIWSSFGEEKYAIGQAVSASGSIKGPWKQVAEPLIQKNGGHGMLFQTFDHQWRLVFHQPNDHPFERAQLVRVQENADGLLQVATDFTPLFNGRNLNGFYTYLKGTGINTDPLGVFTVEKEGILHISGEQFGYLCTHQVYRNFHLKAEFKWGEKKYPPRLNEPRDSGILYHLARNAKDTIWPTSIECQIQQGDCGDFWLIGGTTIVVNGLRNDPKPFYRSPKIADKEKPHGEWNTVEVISQDGMCTHIVNGQVVNEGKLASVKEGKILFQSEGAEIYYRNMQIKEW